MYFSLKSRFGKKKLEKNRMDTYLKFDREIASPFSSISKRLDEALDEEFVDRVKARVLKDNPEWTDEIVDTGFVKLKHFLVLTTMFKNVPMFDDVADEVWHTMILFTRSYEDFCDRFNGGYIHHEPTIGKEVDPYERDRLHVMEFVLYGNLDTFKPKKAYFDYVSSHTISELSDVFLNEECEYVEEVLYKLRDVFDAMFVVYSDNEKKNNRELNSKYSPSPIVADSMRSSSDHAKASSNYTTHSDAAMLAFMVPILLASDVEETNHSHCTANACVASCGSDSGGASGGGSGSSGCNSSSCGSSGGGSSCGSSCGGGCGS